MDGSLEQNCKLGACPDLENRRLQVEIYSDLQPEDRTPEARQVMFAHNDE